MKPLPPDVVAYRRTREFSEATIPPGLRRRHATKAGVWGRICVLQGSLRYRILEPAPEEHVLTPGRPGVVEPEIDHEVKPLGEVRFFVEFLRPSSAEGPRLIVVTGIMAAGKSSVAQGLAERLPKSLHLRGDAFRRAIVRGRVDVTQTPSPEAIEQLRLRYRAAAAAARVYAGAGFWVVYQDIILGAMLEEALSFHSQPLYLVVLCPSAEAVEQREARRTKRGYGSLSVEHLDSVLRAETPRLGMWLDTSELDVDETVERILADLDAARVHAPEQPHG